MPIFIQREIAHWRNLEEMLVPVARRGELTLGPAKFLVLGFELDLMQPKFAGKVGGG